MESLKQRIVSPTRFEFTLKCVGNRRTKRGAHKRRQAVRCRFPHEVVRDNKRRLIAGKVSFLL
jgi:hypothetical protein